MNLKQLFVQMKFFSSEDSSKTHSETQLKMLNDDRVSENFFERTV